MTNHIEEAKKALQELETLTKNSPSGIKHSYDIADKAQTHALLAIAEQLESLNRKISEPRALSRIVKVVSE